MTEGKAAVLIIRGLLDEMIAGGVLTKDQVIGALDRAKNISGKEYNARYLRSEEEAVIDAVKKALSGVKRRGNRSAGKKALSGSPKRTRGRDRRRKEGLVRRQAAER